MARPCLGLGLTLAVGAAFAGCSDSSRGGHVPAARAVTAGVSSGQQSATASLGQASTAGRPATSAHHSGDHEPPQVLLTSPQRAAFTTQAFVTVQGTVTDATGIAFLLVGRDPVTVGAGGAFSHTLPLTPGLNVIEIEAGDPLANITRSAIPVISGQFTPAAQPVADAVAARLNRPAFDAIERVAAQQLGGVNLSQQIMAQNPLFSGSALGSSVEVNATGARFGTPVLDLDPQAGGLGVRAELPAVDVTTRAHGRVIGIPYSTTVRVTADRAIVDATAVVDVLPGGVIQTRVQGTQVDLQNFRFDISNVPGFLENLARGAVRRLIERQVRQQVETTVVTEVNRAIAGANGPITQTVLGRQVTLHVLPTAVAFDPQGLSVLAAGDLTLPAVAGLPPTPGSFTTPGAAPALGTGAAFRVAANDDLLNRIGHSAWRGGLMQFTLDQAAVQQLRLPAWLQLDAFLLQTFFPALIGVVNPGDPLEIELGAGAPPIFQTLPAPDLLRADLGDLIVSIYVAPAGRPRQLVLRAGTQVGLPLGVSIGAGNVIQVAVNGRPAIRTDVFETPLVALDARAVETLLDFVLPPVLQLLPRAWSGFPLPAVPLVQLRNLDLRRDGPAQDFVTLSGDL